MATLSPKYLTVSDVIQFLENQEKVIGKQKKDLCEKFRTEGSPREKDDDFKDDDFDIYIDGSWSNEGWESDDNGEESVTTPIDEPRKLGRLKGKFLRDPTLKDTDDYGFPKPIMKLWWDKTSLPKPTPVKSSLICHKKPPNCDIKLGKIYDIYHAEADQLIHSFEQGLVTCNEEKVSLWNDFVTRWLCMAIRLPSFGRYFSKTAELMLKSN